MFCRCFPIPCFIFFLLLPSSKVVLEHNFILEEKGEGGCQLMGLSNLPKPFFFASSKKGRNTNKVMFFTYSLYENNNNNNDKKLQQGKKNSPPQRWCHLRKGNEKLDEHIFPRRKFASSSIKWIRVCINLFSSKTGSDVLFCT